MEYQPSEGTRMGGSAHSQVASLSGPGSSSQNNAVLEERKDNQQKQSAKASFSLLSLAAAGPSSSSAINSGSDPIASVSALSGNSVEDWNISSSSSPSLSTAVDAAKEGAEATRHQHATAGRSAYVDRAALEEHNVPDPGAWGVWIVLNALRG